MRTLLLSLLTLAASCAAPCSTNSSALEGSSANFSCTAQDGGVAVRYRAFNALDENFPEACTGTVNGGSLSFAVTVRTCAPGASTGVGFSECTLPALAPGRYAVGDRALVVPGDGGLASCE